MERPHPVTTREGLRESVYLLMWVERQYPEEYEAFEEIMVEVFEFFLEQSDEPRARLQKYIKGLIRNQALINRIINREGK